jgi:modulator of FtsH protease
MFALDAYRPDQWRDFFVMVGGAAAVLTGLVFVALSLNADVVTGDAIHRYRAIDTLSGMAGGFVICALVLMGGQDHRAVGIEWLVVATVSISIYVFGHVQAARHGGNMALLRVSRTVTIAVLYVAQLIGAALLVAGYVAGLYVAAAALVVALAFMISGAWLLVVDATTREGG